MNKLKNYKEITNYDPGLFIDQINDSDHIIGFYLYVSKEDDIPIKLYITDNDIDFNVSLKKFIYSCIKKVQKTFGISYNSLMTKDINGLIWDINNGKILYKFEFEMGELMSWGYYDINCP